MVIIPWMVAPGRYVRFSWEGLFQDRKVPHQIPWVAAWRNLPPSTLSFPDLVIWVLNSEISSWATLQIGFRLTWPDPKNQGLPAPYRYQSWFFFEYANLIFFIKKKTTPAVFVSKEMIFLLCFFPPPKWHSLISDFTSSLRMTFVFRPVVVGYLHDWSSPPGGLDFLHTDLILHVY